MTYYDLIDEAPFPHLDIPAPATLSNDSDFTALFHHLLAQFHLSINSFGKRFGYNARQRLLSALLMVLKVYMPEHEVELVRNYPGTLGQIELLFAQVIIEAAKRTA